ncbi:polysaccharide deacetylase family protein [Paenibacillus sp. NEAU-GSW1]|uniref:polysaccharide deacetylase family protein n=1 Tax=Paenibacillus sp. NEAU-GSW1 TaxID=2682486 RepID=UPI0012E26BE2|nr:polysaccharide deacetylase family protein [Paenibacillus sp. NEAU-GSW1]MUT67083.1 polysaccharide deacetylase family protein [Paenibacillus sp. NEAU-GSW1]
MMTNTNAYYRVITSSKIVALTFDIGWGKVMPARVLRVLQRSNVKKATFFVAGGWAQERPVTLRRIRSLGYEIGSHGYLHENYTVHTNAWIIRQVRKTEKAIRAASGVRCRLIRTPNGDLNARVTALLAKLGYRTIHWSVDSLDWTNPGKETIVRRSTHNVRAGDIILLHASDTAQQTADALPAIIRKLRAKGFQFVTVSELIANAR